MKKVNLTIIATIMATFAIAMFAFQPTTTEANNNVSPTATPSPRKIKSVPKSTPKLTKSKRKTTTGYFISESGEMMNWRRKQPRKGHKHSKH